jgi:hypothetical protein
MRCIPRSLSNYFRRDVACNVSFLPDKIFESELHDVASYVSTGWAVPVCE